MKHCQKNHLSSELWKKSRLLLWLVLVDALKKSRLLQWLVLVGALKKGRLLQWLVLSLDVFLTSNPPTYNLTILFLVKMSVLIMRIVPWLPRIEKKVIPPFAYTGIFWKSKSGNILPPLLQKLGNFWKANAKSIPIPPTYPSMIRRICHITMHFFDDVNVRQIRLYAKLNKLHFWRFIASSKLLELRSIIGMPRLLLSTQKCCAIAGEKSRHYYLPYCILQTKNHPLSMFIFFSRWVANSGCVNCKIF